MGIENYLYLCKRYGSHLKDVQWTGGNISVKLTDDEMVIKASWTLLKNVNEEKPGASLSYQTLNQKFSAYLGKAISQENESLLTAEISQLVTTTGARASMETPMHALIPYKYVVHTHNIYANVFLCATHGQRKLEHVIGEWFWWVPATIPWLALAQEISKLYANEKKPKIVFLENHGIIVSADSVEEVVELYETLEERLTHYMNHLWVELLPHEIDISEQSWNTYGIELLPQITDAFKTKEYLTKLFLYPDAVVFGKSLELNKMTLSGNTAILAWFTKQQATNYLEHLVAINYILYAHQQLWRQTQTLPQSFVSYLDEMEQEKYRINLSRTTA